MALGAQYSRRAPLFEVLSKIPHPAQLQAVLPTVAFDQVVDGAARHGLSAWVAENVGTAVLPSMPRLLADARATIANAHRHRRFTLAVLDALLAEGLEPIAVKGAVLAQRLYPNPLVRPSSDVDVLVHAEQLDRAARALHTLSLHRQADSALADPFEDHHHLSFSGQRGLVEVHFRLISSFGRGSFDDAGAQSRAGRFAFEGRPVRVLAPEDEFLYLAVHAANHGFLRASWLVDLQQYLQRFPQLDLELMAQRAARAGFLQALVVTLGLLERLLEVELPPAAAKLPARARRGRVDALVYSGALLESAALSNHRLGSFALRLWMVDSPRRALYQVVDGLKRFARRSLSGS